MFFQCGFCNQILGLSSSDSVFPTGDGWAVSLWLWCVVVSGVEVEEKTYRISDNSVEYKFSV